MPLPNEAVVDSINRRITILSSIVQYGGGIEAYVNYADKHP